VADQRDRWSLIDELFHGALELPEAERRQYLALHAGGDDALIGEVEALLDADRRSHVLLDAPKPTDLPHGLRLGPYALERVLGAGGMSTVYLARRADRQFDKQVAIKLVNQGLSAALTGGRFETERQVLARLEHPNIARLLDAGFNEFGQPYLVMEWVDGVTLDMWVGRERPTLDARLDLWLELAGAVAYAHRNLIVHRDIKPSNVLVGRDGSAKLVDFGIAKLIGEGDEAQTRTAHFTPRYASPEQLLGGPVTTAADVFGLGLLLGELAGGVHPFDKDGASPHEHAATVMRDEPHVPPSVPPDLAAIIRMALRKEPDRRYGSVAALADDVGRFRRGWPVTAQPETYGYRLRKFVTRHRAAVAAALLATALAVAGIGLFVRQARITAVERDRANLEARKTEQVNRFLQSMLGAADPTKEGRDVKVVDVLDRAGERLPTELQGQPEIEAELRSTLAETYQSLGLFDPAVIHRRRALELRERLFGPDDGSVAMSLVELGDALFSRAEYPEAETTLRRALATFSRLGLDESVGAATARRYLAEVLNEVGQFAEAERLHREAIALYRRLLPEDDERVAGALNDLGVILGNRQDFAEAEPLHREALAIMRRVHGPAHLAVAQTLNNLAGVVDYQKRYGEAEPLYREALSIQLQLLGETHDRVVLTRTSLANMFWMKGDYANAESTARAALAGAERGLPDGHPLTAYAHLVIGQSLTDAGRPSEGEPHLRAALAMRRKLLPPGHWLLANTENVLGGCLTLQKRYPEAEALLVPSYKVLLADRGANHDKTRDARRRLASLYRSWGHPDSAAQYAEP
jgi:serine/threonine-protein kinase